MRLKQLRLENFQGVKALDVAFDGLDGVIYGDNGVGKTTVFNAFTWLLFDKPSTGAKNFTPKSRTGSGEAHNLEHVAEAVIVLDDGQEVTLRKVYHEVYQKKRGSSVEVMTGHTTDYFIDGVPTSERDYGDKLEQMIAPAERMKMLTMPEYFAEGIEWTERRRILLALCGEIVDGDVIASSPELSPLQGILQKNNQGDWYSVEEYKKITQTKMSKINEELKVLPERIDEAMRAIPDVNGLDIAVIEKDIDDLERQKAELTLKRQNALSADDGQKLYRQQVQEAQDALRQAELSYNEQIGQSKMALQEELMKARSAYSEKNADLAQLERDMADNEKQLITMTAKRQELLADYEYVSAQRWNEEEGICPTCHRMLPEEDIETLKSDFNKRRSQRLESINEQGLKECSQEMIVAIVKKGEALQQEKSQLVLQLQTLKEQGDAINRNLQAIPSFESTEDYRILSQRLSDLRMIETDQVSKAKDLTKDIDNEIKQIGQKIETLIREKSKFALKEMQEKRQTELLALEKKLGADYEHLQEGLYLCEQFIRTKVRLLDERINSQFQTVRFRLFQEQQNGGLKECCDVLVPNEAGVLVPYNMANHAGRINAGLEIADALGRFWHTVMPIFIDNAESVTHLQPITAQMIRLVVSEQDKTLRIA